MFGEVTAIILDVRAVSIHGDGYFDAILDRGEGLPQVGARLAGHLCPRPPRPGECIRVTMLMAQVSAVVFVDDAAPAP
jgi:hypothetical protein